MLREVLFVFLKKDFRTLNIVNLIFHIFQQAIVNFLIIYFIFKIKTKNYFLYWKEILLN